MKNIKRKLFAVLMMIFVSVTVSCPVTAFAHADPESECSQNEIVKEAAEENEEETEPMGPLTPSGNMTLVDDYGSTEKGGKQFITVTSKNGNYFYIIIDHDDEGNETVHFLNMVDESDLLSLMDEEEQKKYAEDMTDEEEPTEEVAEPTEEPTEEVEEKPVKKGPNVGLLLLMIMVVGGGIFFYMYTKTKGIKSTKAAEDPDMDYLEGEDEDYLSTLKQDQTDDPNEDDYETEESEGPEETSGEEKE